MIIACPACETRFLVDDAAVAGGRRLRCANCDNVWLYSPAAASEPGVEATAAKPEPAAASVASEPVLVEPAAREPLGPPPLRVEPHIEDAAASADAPAPGPAALPRPIGEAMPASQQSAHNMAAMALILFAGVIVVLIAVFATATARDTVVELWGKARHTILAQSAAPPPPQAAQPPAVQPPAAANDVGPDAKLGAGLKVTVVPTRAGDSLVIDGDIVNNAPVARPVPHLRLTLRDGNKSDLVSKIVDPPVGKLAPGATAHFSAVFEHPSIAASKVDVTFATD